MIISMPFFYQCTFRRPRKRTDDIEWFGRSVDVDIPDLSGDDAPIAAAWKFTGRFHSGPRDVYARAYGGHAYSPVVSVHGGDTLPVTPHTVTPTDLHDYDRYLERSCEPVDAFLRGEVDAVPQEEVKHHSGEDEPRDAVVASAARFIFVDGELHERQPLPGLVAKVDYGFPNRITITASDESPNTQYHAMFGLGSMDEALEWAAVWSSYDPFEVASNVEIELFRHELLGGGSSLTSETLRLATVELGHVDDPIATLEDETIDAWQDLRRALARGKSDPSDDNIGHVFAAWETMLTVHDAAFAARHPTYESTGPDVRHISLAAARARWDARPIMDDLLLSGMSPD
jgi:hypothetical protein